MQYLVHAMVDSQIDSYIHLLSSVQYDKHTHMHEACEHLGLTWQKTHLDLRDYSVSSGSTWGNHNVLQSTFTISGIKFIYWWTVVKTEATELLSQCASSWQAVMVKKLHEDYLPDMINRFERRAAANNAPEGWIWGEKVSIVTACVCVLIMMY